MSDLAKEQYFNIRCATRIVTCHKGGCSQRSCSKCSTLCGPLKTVNMRSPRYKLVSTLELTWKWMAWPLGRPLSSTNRSFYTSMLVPGRVPNIYKSLQCFQVKTTSVRPTQPFGAQNGSRRPAANGRSFHKPPSHARSSDPWRVDGCHGVSRDQKIVSP